MNLFNFDFKRMDVDQYFNSLQTFKSNFDLYYEEDQIEFANQFLKYFPRFVDGNSPLLEKHWKILDISFETLLKLKQSDWQSKNPLRIKDDVLKLVWKIETLSRRTFTTLDNKFKPVLIKSEKYQGIVSLKYIVERDKGTGLLSRMATETGFEGNPERCIRIKIEHIESWKFIKYWFLGVSDVESIILDKNFSELLDFAMRTDMGEMQKVLLAIATEIIQNNSFDDKNKKTLFLAVHKLYELYHDNHATIFIPFFDACLAELAKEQYNKMEVKIFDDTFTERLLVTVGGLHERKPTHIYFHAFINRTKGLRREQEEILERFDTLFKIYKPYKEVAGKIFFPFFDLFVTVCYDNEHYASSPSYSYSLPAYYKIAKDRIMQNLLFIYGSETTNPDVRKLLKLDNT